MKALIAFVLGIAVGVAGYWFLEDREQDVRIEAQGSPEEGRVTVSKDELETKAREVGEELKAVGATAIEATNDGAITAAVKAKLAADPDISARRIDVDTQDGVVTLDGLVASAELMERAGRIAKSVPGVKDVKSNLKVQP